MPTKPQARLFRPTLRSLLRLTPARQKPSLRRPSRKLGMTDKLLQARRAGEVFQKLDSETARLFRQLLEEIAWDLENRGGNSSYKYAWRSAAKIIRAHKPD